MTHAKTLTVRVDSDCGPDLLRRHHDRSLFKRRIVRHLRQH